MPFCVMSGIRSYCNPWPPRFSKAAQKALLTGEVYVEGRGGKQIDALIRSLRKGDVVEVVETFLLAPVVYRPQKRRRLLAERIEAIKAQGGTIIELATGSRSNRHLPRMLMRAYEQIANSGRAGVGRVIIGRPAKIRPAEEVRLMELEYLSKRNKSVDTVLVKIGERGIKGVNRAELYRRFGGRLVGKQGNGK